MSQKQLFADLSITYDYAARSLASLFKSRGLSSPQYNVLRILRGAGPQGLACHGISERMLTRVPDVTRLVDRLVAAGYASRQREDSGDRRVVRVRIAEPGLELLAELDEPVRTAHESQFGHLSQEQIHQLSTLLRLARHEK